MADSKNVTRIKATDSTPKKTSAKKVLTSSKVTKKEATSKKKTGNGFTRTLAGIGRYFKGAWYELKQVRWPTRKTTWGMTLAVILFSAFFVALILLLDAFFKFIFELMIK